MARVFQLKLKDFIKDLKDEQVLGAEIERIQVIEFQKRGLAHAHIIFWINKSDTKVIEENMDCYRLKYLTQKLIHAYTMLS